VSRRLALVTFSGAPQLHDDDRVALSALRARGFSPEPVAWDAPVDWSGFDRIVVRSTWDYFQRIEAFRAWLDGLERLGAPVLNPVATLRWNTDKRYLQRFAERGVPTIDTAWLARGEPAALDALLQARGWEEAVVKPAISGGGWRTFRVRREVARSRQGELDALLADGEAMVQPFVREILEDGERSLIFFNRALSHAMRKRPKAGDFLVQLEHGGSIEPFEPPAELLALADRALAQVEGPLLYARVDAVHTAGQWRLNELELIEPMLYLRFAPGADERFADALAAVEPKR
jgi:glutathione synthase/RimK-type ligase-like ATP-grasp enzyme